ncbi:MAG: TRAP transporter substrate-binding protein DctP [Rhodospirillales bacterium]|nr:TRAP transporter substrate-binding protein DctP [Rhodospirillales bacterium]
MAGLAAGFGHDSARAETTLRITTQLPLTTPLGQNLVRFKEIVEAQSNGEMAVEIYPAAQLFTDKEVPGAVASGQIEMGSSSLARFAGTIPAVDIFNVPFLLNTSELIRAATEPDSPVRGPLDAAMTAKGARPLWWQPYGLSVLMTRDTVVRRPQDLKGLKIRTFGKALEQFVNHVGGAATNIGGSRQYLAYERGTVDGGMTGMQSVSERKLYQVMDHLTVTNHSNIEFIVLINERVWQRLEPAQQAIVRGAARTVEIEMRDALAGIEAEAYAVAEANGMTIHRLSAEDVAIWQEATRVLKEVYRTAAGALGEQLSAAAEELQAAAAR